MTHIHAFQSISRVSRDTSHTHTLAHTRHNRSHTHTQLLPLSISSLTLSLSLFPLSLSEHCCPQMQSIFIPQFSSDHQSNSEKNVNDLFPPTPCLFSLSPQASCERTCKCDCVCVCLFESASHCDLQACVCACECSVRRMGIRFLPVTDHLHMPSSLV